MSFEPLDSNTPPVAPNPYLVGAPGHLQPSPAQRLAGPAKVLGIFYVVLGVLGLLGVALLSIVLPSALSVARTHNPAMQSSAAAGGVIGFVLAIVALFSVVLPLLAGFGLLARKPWGRTVAIVNGFLNLLFIPLGTILGGFTLYYMMREGAAQSWAVLSNSVQPY